MLFGSIANFCLQYFTVSMKELQSKFSFPNDWPPSTISSNASRFTLIETFALDIANTSGSQIEISSYWHICINFCHCPDVLLQYALSHPSWSIVQLVRFLGSLISDLEVRTLLQLRKLPYFAVEFRKALYYWSWIWISATFLLITLQLKKDTNVFPCGIFTFHI